MSTASTIPVVDFETGLDNSGLGYSTPGSPTGTCFGDSPVSTPRFFEGIPNISGFLISLSDLSVNGSDSYSFPSSNSADSEAPTHFSPVANTTGTPRLEQVVTGLTPGSGCSDFSRSYEHTIPAPGGSKSQGLRRHSDVDELSPPDFLE